MYVEKVETPGAQSKKTRSNSGKPHVPVKKLEETSIDCLVKKFVERKVKKQSKT